jgi:TonB family protein
MEIKWMTTFLCSLLLAMLPCGAKGQSNETEHSKWRYDWIPDKLTGKDTLAASIESDDGMDMAIERHQGGGTSAYVFLREGSGKLFFCGFSGCTVRLRFDNGKIESWSATDSGNGSNSSLHFVQVANLISRLKRSRRVIIEVPIFEEGPTAFEFFVDRLVWPLPAEHLALEALNGTNEKSEITPPACFYTPHPPYSEEARAVSFHGHVTVEGTVTLEGKIENIRIEKSPGLGLDESILNTLKEWKCKAAFWPNGRPVAYTLPFDINFQIESGSHLGLTLAELQKLYPSARCYYADNGKPETVEFCVVEAVRDIQLLLFGKLSVTREVASFEGGVVNRINATLSEKITSVRKYLGEVIPTSDPIPSLWKYNGEEVSITYKDENSTEMHISGLKVAN